MPEWNFAPWPHLEGVGHAVVADLPALGEAGDQRPEVGRVELDQRVVDVVQQVVAGELEGLRRVERDDVVDLVGDDQRVGRRLGQHEGGRPGGEAERERHDRRPGLAHVHCLLAPRWSLRARPPGAALPRRV